MSETPLEVFGPIEIPHDSEGKKKYISDPCINDFWTGPVAKEMEKKQGCYIFALKVGKGYTPWYIGCTTKNFKNEIFTPDKIKKYNGFLWNGKKGKPVMFFIAMPGTKNKVPVKIIEDMEKFFIHSAVIKNPGVLNSHNTKNLPQWSIKGVIRSGKGKPSSQSKQFMLMMGL